MEDKKTESKETKKKEEDKKEKQEKRKQPEKPKKTEAVVNAKNVPVSTLSSSAVCRFIKGKRIAKAVTELEDVSKLKRAIPMKGGIPHRKGKGMMSGRYATKTVGQFILLLKNLQANANVNGLENPVISEAFANIASRPYGRFGRVRKKRTNIKIKATEKKIREKGK